jgi:hypothetical protein
MSTKPPVIPSIRSFHDVESALNNFRSYLAQVGVILDKASADVFYAPSESGVTKGDDHDHVGGDGATIDHATLGNLAVGDPHTQYQKESEKSQASGYASLDAGVKVPTLELGGAGADASKYLRGDQTWNTPVGSGGGYANTFLLMGGQMSEAYKCLGQAALAATTLTDVYTVPAGKSAVISTVFLCNRSAGAVAVRLSVSVAGAADNDKQYMAYDQSIPANETLAITAGITLAATDVLRAYAASADISVNVFGSEITP